MYKERIKNLLKVVTIVMAIKEHLKCTAWHVQSTLSKTDTFGTGTKYPFLCFVRLIESQIKGVKKGRDQLYVSVLQRCPSYRGVR